MQHEWMQCNGLKAVTVFLSGDGIYLSTKTSLFQNISDKKKKTHEKHQHIFLQITTISSCKKANN